MGRRSHAAGVGFCLLLVVCMTGNGHAWEFGLKGTFYWSYEWYDQMGNRGFFGPYNVDNGTETVAKNLNFWNGGQFDTNFVTGSNAGWSYFNVEFEPEIKINQAIRMRGLYRLGTWGDPAASDYHTQDAPGAKNAFSEGQWAQFWVTSNTPWGVFVVGKRPWKFGTGFQYDGSDAATTESLALVVPYGPFDFGVAFYPYRFAGSSSVIRTQVFRNRVGAAAAYGDPYDLPKYYFDVLDGLATTPGQYFSRADRSGSFSRDFLGFATYSNGSLQIGVLGAVGAYHIGPEALLIVVESPDSPNPPLIPLVSQLSHGAIFLKYNNGRAFLNAEAAWLYWIDEFTPGAGTDTHQHVQRPYTRCIEQWRAFLEAGLYAGPVKVSFMTAWSPGPDRRAGRYIDRQSAAFIWHPTYDSRLGNYNAFAPYTHMFCYNYGSGLNAYNLSGDGYLRDAFVLATRIDYAVASNLNIFASFFWARRTSDGYPWGAIRPRSGTDIDGNIDFSQVLPGPLNVPPERELVPNIPTRDLGYELYTGLEWQLLEGWNFGFFFAYWAPGQWFNYACIDRSVAGWNNLAITGARPDRKIDPVIGGEFYMTFKF